MQHFTRADPARNMRRFYTLHIQPRLFGGCDLVRGWGRTGSAGTVRITHYDTDGAAVAAAVNATAHRIKRGYQQRTPANTPLLPVVSSQGFGKQRNRQSGSSVFDTPRRPECS